MYALVDFDNLELKLRSQTVVNLADAILESFRADPIPPRQLRLRLYGGWFDERILSRNAQRLVADLAAHFPTVLSINTSPKPLRVTVQAELAYSLLAEPNRHLLNTYRTKGAPRGLKCGDPLASGCTATACVLSDTASFVKRGRCPSPGCSVTLEQLMFRAEQKLVDTMLSSDALFLASSFSPATGEPIAIVSADDDLWPAIRTALQMGATITHILPKQLGIAVDYHSDLRSGYIARKL